MQPAIPQKLTRANAAFANGDVPGAVALIIAALEEQPELPVKIYQVLLANLLRLNRIGEGVVWGGKAVKRAPDNVELVNIFAILLHKAGRSTEALRALDRALLLVPHHRGALMNKGQILNELKEGAAAEAIFRELLAGAPSNADLHRSLGKALWAQGLQDGAAEAFRQALRFDPANVDSWLDLSALTVDMGSAAEALTILDEAIGACASDGRLLEAKAVMYRKTRLVDQLGPFLDGLADRYAGSAWFQSELGQFTARFDRQAANHHHRRAVELDPANVDYKLALIANLTRTRAVDEGAYLDEAHAMLRDLPLHARRKAARVCIELAMLCADYEGLRTLGSIEELGRAWAANDQHTALLYQFPRAETRDDRHEIMRQHRLWGDMAKARAARHPIRRPATRRSSSKMRIGFMSSDLREHVVAHFAWPLFEHADRDRFEIYCYSYYRAPEPPPLQRRLANMVDMFRWHPFIGDRDAAQMIADDQLDMLIELGGSTAMNKLDVMAWKPARIGASWLGYPHSAGLDTIDYLLVDPFLVPDDPALLIERPMIMPRSWISMGEHFFREDQVINPICPVRRNGHVTFGTANSPIRYNPPLLKAWAQVLGEVAGSRFIFVRPEAGSQVFQRNIRAHFEAEGIAADRIEFRAVRGEHMPHYNDIDITLDTFPQTGGGGTNCEALWMGVPTVTLVGEALFERLSYSILQNAGLGDLCARSVQDYINTAVALAADGDRLQAIRVGLRDRLRASPLGQTRQFARDFYDLVATTIAARPTTPA